MNFDIKMSIKEAIEKCCGFICQSCCGSVFIDMTLFLSLSWDRCEGASWGNASSVSLIFARWHIICVYEQCV